MTPDTEALSSVESLGAVHEVGSFDCGKEPLNHFLKRFALADQKAGGSRTYVICRKHVVVAYHSLAASSVEYDQAPARIGRGLGRYPIPVMLLARLAVDRVWQGRGLSKMLLKDALARTAAAADIAGIRALFAHAKDDEARAWYKALGFSPGPYNPHHFFLLMKDLRTFLD